MRKRRITADGLLLLLHDIGEDFFPMSRRKAFRKFYQEDYKFGRWDEYFPYSVEESVKTLVRKGFVEIRETQKGKLVSITEKGRKQVLLFGLDKMKPKAGKWDGKWRMVFFDIVELDHRKRDGLRRYLKQLGLMQMQESVWISPFEIRDEVKYLREILEIADGVKMGVLSEVENEKDLKKWFKL